MDNFNSCADDRVPDFLSNPVRHKTRLSVCQFQFKGASKIKSIKIKKQLLRQPIFVDDKQQMQKKYKRFSNFDRYEVTQTQQKQDKLITTTNIGSQKNFVKYKSQQKLPILNHFNLQLNQDFNNDLQKFVRIKKQPPRLNKINTHYRQLSEKNQIIRIKKQAGQQEIEQLQVQKPQNSSKSNQQRCYFIRNLMLNANNIADAQSKQKANLNMLVNKLRQTQRRGKQNIHMLQRKSEQLAPIQLKTNKFNYSEQIKNKLKQQIMERYSKNTIKNNTQIKRGEQLQKQDKFLTAWNIQNDNDKLQIFQF